MQPPSASCILHPVCLILLSLTVAASTLGFTRPPQVPPGLDVSNIGVYYTFGQQITFTARLTSSIPITQAAISFRDINEQNTRVEPLVLNPDGSVSYQYDASQKNIRPFATILFSYQATLADGETVTSGLFNFKYEDNRFPWKSLVQDSLTVHWYEGNDAFGQAALEAARIGLQNMSTLLPVASPAPLDVYVYSTSGNLQNALALGGSPWIAGHADPALGVVLVAAAPGDAQTIELQRQIPHELARVMLYRSLGVGYAHLPAWLNEGIASMNELNPNPDYAIALQAADASDALIPISDLCASFPADSGRAFLAYAESGSFVRYLRDTYGSTGLVALTRAYADGLDCDLGATRAVGSPLNQLDARWRESALGQNMMSVAMRNLSPYLLILGLILIVPITGAVIMSIQRRRDARAK